MGRLAAAVAWGRAHPLAAAVLVGGLLRLVAVLTGYGWFAADDYTYVIEPAGLWLADPQLPYPALNRSELLPWAVYGGMRLGVALGATDPRSILKVAYAGLGAWSLLAIPGVFLLARPRLGLRAAGTAAWLVAAQALMPRISTRALVEVACIVPLIWALVMAERAWSGRYRARLAAGAASAVLLGVAMMLRLQVGVVGLAVLGWLVWRAVRAPTDEREVAWAPVIGWLCGSLLAVHGLGAVDLLTGQPFLDTAVRYLAFNVSSSSQFGTSPWYNYVLHLLAYTIPPVTLLLARPMWQAARAHPLVAAVLVVFVLAHVLVPHKEDRFMFPILPVWFVVVAAGLAALREGGRWARRGLRAFWAVNLFALVVAISSDGHRNLTVPLAELAAGPAAQLAVIGVRQVPAYYLAGRAEVRRYDDVAALGRALQTGRAAPDRVLVRPADPALAEQLAALGLVCDEGTLFAGDLVDQALVALNPSHNRRRSPTMLWRCNSGAPSQSDR